MLVFNIIWLLEANHVELFVSISFVLIHFMIPFILFWSVSIRFRVQTLLIWFNHKWNHKKDYSPKLSWGLWLFRPRPAYCINIMALDKLFNLQFCIDMVHAGYGFMHHNFCFWSLLYGLSMLYLFTTFYVNAYVNKSTATIEKSKNK